MNTAAALSQAKVQRAINSALRKSADQRLWQSVVVTGATDDGAILCEVPSQRDPRLTYTVALRKPAYRGQPSHERYSCTCQAARLPACAHRAAVYQWFWRRHFAAPGVPTSIRSPAPAPQPAARAA